MTTKEKHAEYLEVLRKLKALSLVVATHDREIEANRIVSNRALAAATVTSLRGEKTHAMVSEIYFAQFGHTYDGRPSASQLMPTPPVPAPKPLGDLLTPPMPTKE